MSSLKEIHYESRLMHSPLFWDVLIALLLIVGTGSTVTSWTWIALHPQSSAIIRFILGLLGFLGLLGTLLVLWGSFVEPRKIKVNTKSIHVKGLPGLKIVIVGDFHVGPYKGTAYLRRVVNRVNALQPDLILLPGDFIFDHRALTKGLEPLKNLQATYGVFAVLGNHDTGHMLDRKNGQFFPYRMPDRTGDVVHVLERLGITVLRNERRIIATQKKSFALSGTDHCWMDSCDLSAAFKKIPVDMPVILLSHIPDVILDKKSERAALIISGHTHGGQIRLPFIGSIYPIPDELGRAFDQGLFNLGDNRILAITHGIGETMARARLFCPPEILVLEVRAHNK